MLFFCESGVGGCVVGGRGHLSPAPELVRGDRFVRCVGGLRLLVVPVTFGESMRKIENSIGK